MAIRHHHIDPDHGVSNVYRTRQPGTRNRVA